MVSDLKPKFPLGRTVITRGADEAFQRTGEDVAAFLRRHNGGDWGEMGKEDVEVNEEGLRDGQRLMSAYYLKDGTKIWIITEWDRSVTTLLLPDEY